MTGPASNDASRDWAASIVITNHDYGRFVRAAIESALDQTVACQVVVVDDGSTDDSIDAISAFGPAVELVTQANGGQGAAINTGFDRCLAPIVFFLDGDDLLAADAAEAAAAALQDQPDAARCHFELGFVDTDGRPLPGGLPEPGRALPRDHLLDRLTVNPDDIAWQPTSGNAFAASALRAILPMPTEPYRISADHYLSNLSALHGPVVAIDRVLGSYRLHGDNADHRAGFDLDRARSILVRTRATRMALIDHGRRLGLEMPSEPDRFRSLSNDATRLVSFRSSPRNRHPFDQDRWPTLVGRALRSAAGRRDLRLARRGLALAWVGALAIAPPRLLASIAARGLTR